MFYHLSLLDGRSHLISTCFVFLQHSCALRREEKRESWWQILVHSTYTSLCIPCCRRPFPPSKFCYEPKFIHRREKKSLMNLFLRYLLIIFSYKSLLRLPAAVLCWYRKYLCFSPLTLIESRCIQICEKENRICTNALFHKLDGITRKTNELGALKYVKETR